MDENRPEMHTVNPIKGFTSYILQKILLVVNVEESVGKQGNMLNNVLITILVMFEKPFCVQ
jgi:hypothetical protein